ncbi:MAG: ribonuclease Y [Rubricoccaceae bacterium]|nr:ribonuclease Y [Rubricoccaceae bacterium]
MDPQQLVLLAVGVLLGLGVGIGIGRRLHVGAVQRRLDAALAEAEAEGRRVKAARSEVEKGREELRRQRQRLEQKATETKAKGQRLREKLDARKAKLDARARRLTDREGALLHAADALDLLHEEAEKRRAETEALRAQVQTLATTVARRQQELATREQASEALAARLDEERGRLERLVEEHLQKLERAAGMGRDEAVHQLMGEMTREAKLEAAALVKDARDEARRTAQREAQKVVLKSIQRLAAQTTIEHTVSAVPLQSDDMKGRVIGREGRNIRAFEAATGIEVIVDDTPEAVLVSGFDPVRREVARLSMERLLADGRIHPARIEEVVEKTRGEVEEEIVEAGEAAALELQIHGLHPELVRHVGRMKFRTSFGQNLLAHSVEVAKLSSLMAAELGLDARKARRGGLLHDIGKVAEEDLESPHAIVGMELCRRYKEHPDVCNAVGAHHDEVAMATPIAPLVQAADAISGARPGARREALERYVQRLQHLESLAGSFDGVERVYAIQAGREIRVIVDHAKVTDAVAETLAADIARRIEREMEYPGQVKVNVIREVRAVAYAR